jgi:hypothetical protein
MPASSKKQFKLFKLAELGKIKLPGLSKKEAREYTSSNKGKKSYKNLPEFAGIKKMMKKKA